MKRCLIYLDTTEQLNSIELLEVARQIYKDEPYETVCVSFNEANESLIGYVNRLIRVTAAEVKGYDSVAVTEVMVALQQMNGFDSILIPGTHFGRMMAPRLAMKLGTGLVADVTAIGHRKGELEIIRPAFSGRIMAGIVSKGRGPVMMTVRQGVFHYEGHKDLDTLTEVYRPAAVKTGGIELLSEEKKEQAYDIRESDVLVSGGGGVIKGFHHLEGLAQKLNGQVSASRKIVDKGIAGRTIQVGQSGKTVSPRLYLALGIYGAIQHVEGLKQVEHMISVNLNKDAPICSLSDIVVEGDAVTFIEKLIERIEEDEP